MRPMHMRSPVVYQGLAEASPASSSFYGLVSASTAQAGAPSLTDAMTAVALQQAADYATRSTTMVVNRARAAALADYGYEKMQQFESYQPLIFAVSASTLGISVAMGIRRRRVPEALALYSTLGLLSAGMAWFTRPAALRPAPAPIPAAVLNPAAVVAPPPAAPGQPAPEVLPVPPAPIDPGLFAQVLGWLDRRVAERSASNPGWEAGTWHRLAYDLGLGTITSPVNTLLTRNSQ